MATLLECNSHECHSPANCAILCLAARSVFLVFSSFSAICCLSWSSCVVLSCRSWWSREISDCSWATWSWRFLTSVSFSPSVCRKWDIKVTGQSSSQEVAESWIRRNKACSYSQQTPYILKVLIIIKSMQLLISTFNWGSFSLWRYLWYCFLQWFFTTYVHNMLLP